MFRVEESRRPVRSHYRLERIGARRCWRIIGVERHKRRGIVQISVIGGLWIGVDGSLQLFHSLHDVEPLVIMLGLFHHLQLQDQFVLP